MPKPVVEVAVVPCAGLGTRLRPLTRVVPKELLPYGDRPLIEHLLEELVQAGIGQAILVIRKDKEMLRRHLEAGGVPAGLQVEYAEQLEPRGLADALRAARTAVGERPFLMALPDQQHPSAAAQLLPHYSGQRSLSSMITIPPEELALFPGAVGLEVQGPGPVHRLCALLDDSVVSCPRAFGRTVYSAEFLATLPARGDESDFARCFASFFASGEHGVVHLQGPAADLGTMPGYLYYQNRSVSTSARFPQKQ